MLLKYARRIVISIMGGTVILIGIAMLVLPGPGLVVIPVGLAILATEYAWAHRWLRFIRESAEKGADKLGIRPFLSRLPFLSFLAQKKNRNTQEANPGE
jgi:uncharacterized protein (TIGR02611 family)